LSYTRDSQGILPAPDVIRAGREPFVAGHAGYARQSGSLACIPIAIRNPARMHADTARRPPREHFHPLEAIPYFRRIPRSFARDFAYTFVWNGLFALFFYMMTVMATGRLASLHTFKIIFLISNVVGYSIHFLFSAGGTAGFDVAARRRGLAATAAYYSLVPMLGVISGFLVSSLFIDVGFRSAFFTLNAILPMLFVSLVISMVLTVIFFWRERSAVADAALAREREKGERIEREAALANLRALQAQIEPHFLFNTLANVTSLVDPDPAKAKRMLESFNRFLRSSLASTRMEKTTLGAEGELIGAFLDVLQVRMGDRLRYRVDIAPDLAAFELPPMLVQPVVENAIHHGLEPKVDGGEVIVAARREGAAVAIEVRDTGVGFDPTTRGGLGLTNVRDRLRLLYGDSASLAIGENAPAGTVVVLRLPA
jgi:signal transduction histidine kinase